MAKVIKSGFGRPPAGERATCPCCRAEVETDGNDKVTSLENGLAPPYGWYIECPECGYRSVFIHKDMGKPGP